MSWAARSHGKPVTVQEDKADREERGEEEVDEESAWLKLTEARSTGGCWWPKEQLKLPSAQGARGARTRQSGAWPFASLTG